MVGAGTYSYSYDEASICYVPALRHSKRIISNMRAAAWHVDFLLFVPKFNSKISNFSYMMRLGKVSAL